MRAAKILIRSTLALAFLAPQVALTSTGCTNDSPAPARPDCPNDLPASCPADVPSYKTTVSPIVARRCLACHGDGGIETSKFDFSTYDDVHAHASPMLNQVYGCLMPPLDAGALTPDERKALLDWLVCHAPNN